MTPRGLFRSQCGLMVSVAALLVLLAVPDAQAQTAGTGFDLRDPSINLTTEEINAIAVNIAGTTSPIDFDGDGNYEVVTRADNTGDSDCQIRIYEKTGANTFAAQGTGLKIAVGTRQTSYIRGLFVANLDGDAALEIAVSYENANGSERVGILDVSAAFAVTAHPNGPVNPADDTPAIDYVGDLDGDGNPEFIVGDIGGSSNLEVFEWNGAGWSSRVSVAAGGSADGVMALAVGNLDGDSDPEVAVSSDSSDAGGGLGIWQISQSGGTFSLTADGTVNNNFTAGTTKGHTHVKLYDLDGDGDLEIICVHNNDDDIRIYERTGTTTYDTDIVAGLITGSANITALACGDHDNDGKGEIYYSTEDSQTVSFREHDGTANTFASGNFAAAATLVNAMGASIEAGAIGFCDGDGQSIFDGDTYRDIFVGTFTTTTKDLYFLESQTADTGLPAPTVTIDNTGTPAVGNLTAGNTDEEVFGFRLTPASGSFSFTAVSVTKVGSTTSSDLSNFRVVYDADNSGTYNVGDTVASTAAQPISALISFTITGQTGISAARRYLVIADVAGSATGGNSFTGSINASGDVTTSATESGTAAGNLMTVMASANSSASDIIRDGTFTEPSNIAYGSYQEANLTSSSLQVGQFTIRDGGGSADADAVGTTLDAITFTVANGANLRRVALYDGTTEIAEVAGGASVVFSGLSGLVAADGGTKTFKVLASFNGTVTDNHQLTFTVSSATANSGGSTFATAAAGGSATDTTSDRNRLEVTATKLVFSANDSAVGVSQNFSATVQARDADENVDLDSTASVTISQASGGGTLSAAGGLTKSLSSGAQSWSDLQINTAGTITISAAGGSLTTATSGNIVASALISKGDVVIVRVNNSTDGFTALALRALSAGETLYWTDEGWLSSDAFRGVGEGAGTTDIITSDVAAGSTFDVSCGTGISGSGDQMFLFRGTKASPTLIYGVDWGNTAGWDANATDSNTSADPAVTSGATLNDVHTVSLGSSAGYKYTGTKTGSASDLLTAIANSANWSVTTDTTWGDGAFTIVTFAAEPTTHASAVNFTSVGPNGMTVNWTTGDGANCIVVAKSGSAPTGTPTDGQDYTANAAYGTGGTALGDGFVVYNGALETVTLSGLSVGTTCYVKIFEYNGSGATANYYTTGTPGEGNQVTDSAPTLDATPTSASVETTTATLGGNVTATGGDNVTERGIHWSTTDGFVPPAGTKDSEIGSFGAAAFTRNVTGLPAGTTVYFRSFALNGAGTTYSASQGSILMKPAAPNATAATGATSGGFNANWDASTGATSYRLDVATDSGFTSILGSYNDLNVGNVLIYAVSGLSPSTPYYYRVRAVNATGTGGNSGTITANTTATLSIPTLITPTATGIGDTTATLGATITADGNDAITARGTVWGTSANPVGNALAEGNTAVSAFTHARSGLTAGTLIYYRGYAVNGQGTAYSEDGTFYTLSTEPTAHAGSFAALAASGTSIDLTWTTAGGANGYLILQRTGADPTGTPTDGTGYTVGNTIGDGTVAAIVTPGSATAATIGSLTANTVYHFAIVPFAWDGVNNGTLNYRMAATVPTANAGTLSALSDAVENDGTTDNIAYATYQEAANLTAGNSVSVFGIRIRDGGAGADNDTVGTELTTISFTVNDAATLRRAALYDGGTELAEIAVSGSPLVFSGVSATAADGGTKDLTLRVSFTTAVTDNQELDFAVSAVTAAASGSGFAAADGGGATSDTAGDANKIEVTATTLAFTAAGPSATVAQNFSATVQAQDALGILDLDDTTSVTITKASGSGTLTGGGAQSLVAGARTFAALSVNAAGALTLQAAGGSLSSATSGTITISPLLAVLRANESDSNSPGTIVKLDPSTANQSSPATVAIPATGASAMRLSGSASSTGYLTRSLDGSLLCFTAANNTDTTSNVNSLNPRGVGSLNANDVFSVQTTYTGGSGNQTRGATSLDNATWFIGDQGGLYSNGTSAGDPADNIRSVKAFGGTVYAFRSSTSYAAVSSVSAATGGSLTQLAGLPLGASTLQDFYLVSSGSNGSTFDVLYILQATSATVGTIYKYSLVSGTWTANGTAATTFGGFGLAAAKNGAGADLFITSGTGATAANTVRKLTDSAGYNAAISVGAATTLHTAGAGTILKGIDFCPVAVDDPSSQASGVNFASVGQSQMTVQWSSGGGAGRLVVCREAADPSPDPVDGTTYTAAANFQGAGSALGGGKVIYVGTGSSVLLTGLDASTTYHVAVYEYNGSGATINYLTPGATGSQATLAPVYSTLSDIVRATGFSELTDVAYASYQEAADLTTGNSIELARFTIRDGGASAPDSDSFGTTLEAITISVANAQVLRRLALYDGTTELGEVAAGSSVTFSSLSALAADDGELDLSVRASFQSTVVDNTQVGFTITSASASVTGSGFAALNAGAAASDITGDANRIEVTATALDFTSTPVAVVAGAYNFMAAVAARDALDNLDLDDTTSVTITKASGPGALAGGGAQSLVAGYLQFTGLQFDTVGSVTLQAAGGSLANGTSGTVLVNALRSPGDVAFTAFNAANDDDFAIVVLTSIPADTRLYFGDNEWTGTAWNNLGEGTMAWDVGGSAIPAGTVIAFNNTGLSGSRTVTTGTLSGGTISLSTSSEGIWCYQSNDGSNVVSFLAAIANDTVANGFGSLTGTGLTAGDTAINLTAGSDIAQYKGARTTHTPSGYRVELNVIPLNWDIQASGTGTDTTVPDLPWDTTAFTITADPPTTGASVMTFSPVSSSGMTVNWTSGNGAARIVVARQGSAVSFNPNDGTGYTADGNFSTATDLGSGNKVVYSGSGSSVAVTGLDPSTTYHFAVFEFNGSGATANYYQAGVLNGSQSTLSPYDNDSVVEAPASQVAAGDVSSLADTLGEAVDVFTLRITDAGSGDGFATKVTQLTIQPAAGNTADWTDSIQGIALYNVTAASAVTFGSPTISDTSIVIPITSGNLDVADGSFADIRLSVYLNTAVVDNGVLQFEVTASGHGFSTDTVSSSFAPTFPGGDVTGNAMTIRVLATKLAFDSVATSTPPAVNFSATVAARDANENVDTDATTSVTITKATGPGTLTGGGAQSLVSGSYTFSALQLSADGTYTLDASGGALTTATSGNIVVATVYSTLSPGDIAFIAYASDSPDRFAFIPTVNIADKASITFTDNRWDGAALLSNENTVTWTNNTGSFIAAGTVITITDPSTVSGGGATSSGNWTGFSASGDQVLAYQGSAASPNFIAGLSSKDWNTTADNSNSQLPAALTLGTHAVGFASEVDNGYYHGTTTGTRAQLLGWINDNANWTRHTDNQTWPTPWTFVVESLASEPASQVTTILFANVQSTQMDVSWTDGTGAGRLVIARQGSAPSGGPVDGTTYTEDADFTGAGSALGSGKVVYIGTGSSFTLTGLNASTTYHVQVFEYNGSGGTINYLTSTASGNPASQMSAAPAFDAESDLVRNGAFSEPENLSYQSYQSDDITDVNSIELARFTIRDGGSDHTDSDSAGTTLTAITLAVTGDGNLRRVALYDGSTELGEVAAGASVAFTGLTGLTASDDSDKVFSVRATFLGTVTDNAQVQFAVTAATADSGGSTFAAADAGGAASSTTGDRNRIEVTATALAFSAVPGTAAVDSNFSVTVQARDANGNLDLDDTTSVTITKASGSGTLTGGGAQSLTSGTRTFSTLQVDAADTYMLDANGGSLTGATSGSIVATETLVAGDVTLIGYREDATDGFVFVTWKNLAAGTVLYFTDSGFFSDGTMRDSEDRMSWTAPAGGVAPGTVVTVSCTAVNATPSVGTCVGTLGSLANGGDQIFVGTGAHFPNAGDTTAPGSTYTGTLLYGLNMEGNWAVSATGTGNSALPAALSGLYQNQALSPADDNGQYTGDRSSQTSFVAYKALIHTYGQWAFENTGTTVFNGTAFSLAGVLAAPVAYPGVGLNPFSVNAIWSAVSGATDYRLDVSLHNTFTAPAMLPSSNAYHNGTLGQAGWTETLLNQGNAAGTDYLRLTNATSVLSTPSMDFDASTAETLNFKMRTYNGANVPMNTITVSVSDDNGSSWTLLGTRVPLNTTLTAAAPFDLSAYTGNQVMVKLESLGANGTVGAGVDDVTVDTLIAGTAPSYVTGYENLSVGNVTNQVVVGLEPATPYYYRVRATATPQTSDNSNVESATTKAATTVFMFK